MKKTPKTKQVPEMLNEYDFSKGERGKYAKRYANGTNIVVLDADIAAAYPTSTSVNEALRKTLRNSRSVKK